MFLNAILYISWNVDPEIVKIGGFSLRYYSLMFVLAFGLGYRILITIYKRENALQKSLDALLIYVLLGTVIGARLGHTLFYEFDYFKNHPLEIILPFRISKEHGFELTGFAGLASHGGAIGILIAVAMYSKKYKQHFLWVLDRLVIAVALGGFFIRIGNLFNSEILGIPTSVSWAFIFKRIDNIPRHPAQLYEAILYFLTFCFLWTLYKIKKGHFQKGLLLGYFLVFVFSARFIVEFVKEDQEAFEQGWFLNMGQILSVPFILIGIYLVTGFNRRVMDQSKKNYHEQL